MFVGYNAQYALAAPTGSTGSWGFDASVLPHPIAFMHVDSFDDSLAHTATVNFNNAQIVGADHNAQMINFRAMAERWRLA